MICFCMKTTQFFCNSLITFLSSIEWPSNSIQKHKSGSREKKNEFSITPKKVPKYSSYTNFQDRIQVQSLQKPYIQKWLLDCHSVPSKACLCMYSPQDARQYRLQTRFPRDRSGICAGSCSGLRHDEPSTMHLSVVYPQQTIPSKDISINHCHERIEASGRYFS